jgi:cephalosporin hydroxylase
MTAFDDEVRERIVANGRNRPLRDAAAAFVRESTAPKYSYNFSWLGRPIIQFPQDIVAVQELVWTIQPELIIETGIAHGGSLILSASLLEIVAACGGPRDGRVIGIDIDIRAHNRAAIEAHPLAHRITMFEASSTDPRMIARVVDAAAGRSPVLVLLDSNHTHDHVLGELEAYAPLVTPGSYCVVFDTVIETLPAGTYPDRPWGPGDNPMSAVDAYLDAHPEFEVDDTIEHKLLVTVAPRGYLRRVR